MARVRISAAARADLTRIDAYSVDSFGDTVADTYLRGFTALFDLLREQPLSGAAQTDLGAGLRALTHRRHRVFYRVDGQEVLIVRILHHAQDARGILLAR